MTEKIICLWNKIGLHLGKSWETLDQPELINADIKQHRWNHGTPASLIWISISRIPSASRTGVESISALECHRRFNYPRIIKPRRINARNFVVIKPRWDLQVGSVKRNRDSRGIWSKLVSSNGKCWYHRAGISFSTNFHTIFRFEIFPYMEVESWSWRFTGMDITIYFSEWKIIFT